MRQPSVTFCVYDYPSARGGPSVWAIDLALALHSAGVIVIVLVLCPGGHTGGTTIAEDCHRLGISCYCGDIELMTFLEQQVEWILNQWKVRPTQVFIANSVIPALFASQWIRKAGAKSVMVVHSNPEREPFYRDAFEHFVSGEEAYHMDSVVCVSDYIAKQVMTIAPAGMKVATIPCGSKLSPLRSSRQSNFVKLLYCGRLVQEAKRIREVTDALLSVTVKLPGVTASICGDGPEREWLVKRLEGQNKVQYLGAIEPKDMQSIMCQHHVIVLLSDYEGLSMALVEGMSCGLVPICLDEPSGAREVLRNARNGFIVKDREADFFRAVEALCDRSIWGAMSEEAHHTVQARYCHPVVMEKWRTLICELAAPVQLDMRKWPRRINLASVRQPGSFDGYPHSRPSRCEIISSWPQSIWYGLRTRLRPLSRIRAIASRAGLSQRPSK